jgi:hypothetical protein
VSVQLDKAASSPIIQHSYFLTSSKPHSALYNLCQSDCADNLHSSHYNHAAVYDTYRHLPTPTDIYRHVTTTHFITKLNVVAAAAVEVAVFGGGGDNSSGSISSSCGSSEW